jgi:hypothetical protein
MKLYNPFKPHIIEICGKFWIRKLSILGGWVYLDNQKMSAHWYSLSWLNDFNTHEDASIKLSALPTLIKSVNEFNKVKVHV